MTHTVLLPTDFSENAWKATLYALKLYNNEPCTFYYLHTWSLSDSTNRSYITSSYIDKLKEESKEKLRALKAQAEGESSNSKCTFKIIQSEAPLLAAIETAVTLNKIDLVLMGTKGTTGAKEFLFGSNTVNIISNLKQCPVLAVPEFLSAEKPTQISFATDFKHAFGEELLPLTQLSTLHDSKISVVHISEKISLTESQNANLEILKATLKEYPHSFHLIANEGTKAQTINNFINEFEIDMLAIIRYKHNFIARLINEPVVKRIGKNPAVPFLVIPCIN